MEPLYIKKTDKILIIAPHPDDECIGPEGLLLLFKKLCQIIVCTDGSIGQDEFSTDLCKHIRHEEFLNERSISICQLPLRRNLKKWDCIGISR